MKKAEEVDMTEYGEMAKKVVEEAEKVVEPKLVETSREAPFEMLGEPAPGASMIVANYPGPGQEIFCWWPGGHVERAVATDDPKKGKGYFMFVAPEIGVYTLSIAGDVYRVLCSGGTMRLRFIKRQ